MNKTMNNGNDLPGYGYSVLMTVYAKENPAHFEWAIRSMLFQTVKPNDFVIVCDGALTPELDAVIEHYVRLEPVVFQILRLEENCGSGVASRQGLLLCRNNLVARMDSDDLAAVNRAELLLQAFQNNPELSVVGGQMAEFQGDYKKISAYRILPTEHEDLMRCAASRSPLNNITVMFRKSAALEVGNYNDIRVREDYDLWIRMLSAGYRMTNLPRVLAFARVGEKMYARRRGIQYFRYAVRTEKLLLKNGFISPVKFGMELTMRFAASVLLPERFSHWLFRRLMRSKDHEIDTALMKNVAVAAEVFQDCVAASDAISKEKASV